MLVITRQVDQWIMIGDEVLVGPTDIDAKSARVLAKGRMIGGPEDGGTFQQAHELTPGQSFQVGPMIVVTLMEVRGDRVRLGILRPPHMPVHRKEHHDTLKDPNAEAD